MPRNKNVPYKEKIDDDIITKNNLRMNSQKENCG